MYALLASLPRTVYTKESLQAIITGASTADERADAETLQIIRRALAYLVRGSSVQVSYSGRSRRIDARSISITGTAYKWMLPLRPRIHSGYALGNW
jgi:hypothetical protein